MKLLKAQSLIGLFATGFGLGKSPKAPGTVGTLGAIPLVFLFSRVGPIGYLVATMALVFAGIMICQAYADQMGKSDPPEVVFDEIVGFLIAMTWMPLTWKSFVLAFLIFRLLDIVKPPPIRKIDRKIKGGLGIMADDIAAGIITNIVLQVIYTKTMWLF